jgi:DNA-binding NarL/FixJ family response regulator
VALTSFHNTKLVRAALEAGAIGYLLKDLSIDQLAEAIRAAHRGRSIIDPLAAQALAATPERPDDSEAR